MPITTLTTDDLTDLVDALETLVRISEAIEPERDNEKHERWCELLKMLADELANREPAV